MDRIIYLLVVLISLACGESYALTKRSVSSRDKKTSYSQSSQGSDSTTGKKSRSVTLDDLKGIIIIDGVEYKISDVTTRNPVTGDLQFDPSVFEYHYDYNYEYKSDRSNYNQFLQPGKTITKEYKLNDHIHKINNFLPIDITYEYSPSGKGKVVVTGPENYVALTMINERGDAVDFRGLTDFENRIDYSKLRITVYLSILNEVNIFSSGDFSASAVNSDSFVLNIMGTGDAFIKKIMSTIVKIQISGTGDMKSDVISGTLVQCYLGGTGDIAIKYLDATSFNYSCYGTGDLILNSIKSTTVDLTSRGTGDISFSEVKATGVTVVSEGIGDIILNDINVNLLSLVQKGKGTMKVSGKANQISQEGHSGDINISRLKYNIKSYK